MIIRLWDGDYFESLIVEEVPDGVRFTITMNGESIVIPAERMRDLRLALQRFERQKKKEED